MKARNSKSLLVTGIVAALFLALSAGVEAGDPKELGKAIADANAEFMKRFAAGSGTGVAELYTEDGQLLPPNSETISGHAAIGEFWQGAIDSGVKGAKLKPVEVEGAGEIACEVGIYALMDGEGNALDKGKYMVLWKQEEGQWKLHRDIWNSNLPLPTGGEEE